MLRKLLHYLPKIILHAIEKTNIYFTCETWKHAISPGTHCFIYSAFPNRNVGEIQINCLLMKLATSQNFLQSIFCTSTKFMLEDLRVYYNPIDNLYYRLRIHIIGQTNGHIRLTLKTVTNNYTVYIL